MNTELKNLLNPLSARERAIFVLRDLEEFNTKEVAQVCEIPQTSVRWYLRKARVKLRVLGTLKKIKENFELEKSK